MTRGRQQLARWAALGALLATGCQVGPGAVEPRPREHVKVRLGVVLLSDEAREAVLAGLHRDPNIADIEEFRGDLSFEERSFCEGRSCQLEPKLCAWARERALDFTALAVLTAGEHAVNAPGQAGFPDEHLHSESSPGPLISYGAWARLRLAIFETRTCRERPDLSRRVEGSTGDPPSRGGGPDRERHEVLAATPAALADTFPALLRVGPDGEIRALLRDVPTPPGVYDVFDQRRFVGAVSLPEGDSPPWVVKRLTCCFAPRPGNTLVHARDDYLFELAPSFSSATATLGGQIRPALGFGLHVRYRTIVPGWHGGVAFDFLYPSGVSFFLGALEAGYQWRPAPALAFGVLVDAGGGFASTPQTRAAASGPDRRGLHAAASLMASFQPARAWFVGFDLGYIQSLPYASAGSDDRRLLLQGPLLRVTGGLR
jgi:hypothetical protein